MKAPYSTRDLLAAVDQGAEIRTVSGIPVEYRPERKGDRKPWMQVGTGHGMLRFPASVCRPHGRNGGPWAVASLLRLG